MKIMKNDLILEREIQLETWVVSATISKAEKRPEYDLILKCIRDGVCTEEQVAQHLLFDDRARLGIAQRMLNRAIDLNLAFKKRGKYALTDEGYEAIKEQRIFVPEEGVWKITFSNDPLLPFPIMAIEKHAEPKAMDEALRRNKHETDKRIANFKKIPHWIKNRVQDEVGQPCTGGEIIHIGEIKLKGETVDSPFKLSVKWNVTKQSLTLYKDSKEVSKFKAPNRDLDEVWYELLLGGRKIDSWRNDTAEFEEYFDDVPDSSKSTMRINIEFPRPSLNGLNRFNSVIAKGVRLRPKTEVCAQRWSEWLLLSYIDNYATVEKYEKWLEKAKMPFKDFEINLPSRDELANSVILDPKARSKRDWHIVAAADWGL
ncbi:hypothetical protein ACOGST_002630 [Vibrio alginolyticus]|uniref:hypothetical protein n=1 Tax=Vibrio harveyi group TaxID=717610 RepID=UPI001B8173C9|nr:hypothetical protein [Vibrio parahaemolyticus]HBC3540125.1 hypothetical protein [Vibrio parahaemolyticus]HBC3816291.1 hypothetical protein [Vibrio parahaemolyticus]